MGTKTADQLTVITTLNSSDKIAVWKASSSEYDAITFANLLTNIGITGYLKLDGTSTMTGTLALGTNAISGVTTINSISLTTGFVLAAGTVPLTGDWDIGSGRKIKGDQVQARSASGLKLYDFTSATGLFVADGGNVGIRTTTPTLGLLQVAGTITGGGLAGLYFNPSTSGSGTQYGIRVLGDGSGATDYIALACTGAALTNMRSSIWISDDVGRPGLNIGFPAATATQALGAIIKSNVGINTSSPLVLLHVVETGTSLRGIMSAQHNTATTPAMLKLRKSRGSEASPTTVASADILGMIQPNGYDGGAYRDTGSITFVVDSSVSSTNVPTGILFNTTASNGDGTERMRIRSDGTITMGGLTLGDTLVHIYAGSAGTVAASASTNLTVEGSGDNGISLLCPNANINAFYFGCPANSTVGQVGYLHSTNTLYLLANGTEMDISASAVFPATDNAVSSGKSGKRWSALWSGNGTIQTSDMRMKTQTAKSNLGLDFVLALKPLKWVWEDSTFGRVHHGLAAQDVKQTLDEQSAGDFGGYVYDGETDRHHLRYSEFVAPLINAIQEQQAMISQMAEQIKALTGKTKKAGASA